MFRTLSRIFLPNRLDWLCKHSRGKKILLAWNRGLGDIALGLYAVVDRIRHWIPDAEITFLIREDLQEGFSLLKDVCVLPVPHWKRGEAYNVKEALQKIGIDAKAFDLIIPWPNPTHWVQWQHGKLVPKLVWNQGCDALHQKFELIEGLTYIGVQWNAETNYGLWRNWPLERWHELFDQLKQKKQARVILFGFGTTPHFESDQIIDLRGKTTLFELLAIVKNRCHALIAPDSGILSMVYYLDVAFPLRVVSLWADPNHGILKQNVASPNPLLIHRPLIGKERDLSTVSANLVLQTLYE